MEHFLIKNIDGTTFDASEYQDIIFNEVKTGSNNMIISAAAGASKTTTIVNCINIIPNDLKVLFIAFNRDIVKSIKGKIGTIENSSVMTFHSLGFSILKENNIINNNIQINEFKYRNYIKNNIEDLSKYKEIKSLKKNKKIYIDNICSLIEYSRYYLCFSKREIRNIAEQYGISPIRDEFDVVKNVLEWGKGTLDTIDYTDMIWLPNVLNLNTYRHLYDWVLIDEAQDTSIAEQEIVFKCFKRGTRFIAVGDNFQKINIWCGASDKAIENFLKRPNTKEYKLPISYRCPKKIVKLASNFSDNIIAKEDAIEGEINVDVSKNLPKSNDMVLCRTTAPLVELHLNYNRINKKSFVVGFEHIKEQYTELIKNTGSSTIDRNCLTSNGLFPKMYTYLFEEIDRLKKNFHLDNEDAYSHPKILTIYDAIEGINAISEGLTSVQKLLEKINIIFDNDDKDAVRLSTVHKAKGLEADNVYILYPSLMPSKMAKKDWEKKTERNLIYVAYTRAKKTLNFIKEENKTNINNGAFDVKTMIGNLNKIRSKINYNSENGVVETDIYTNTEKKEDIVLGIPKVIDKHNSKKAGSRLRNLLDE